MITTKNDIKTINADLPILLRYSSIQDRIQAMTDPSSLPDELELTATTNVLEKPIFVLKT